MTAALAHPHPRISAEKLAEYLVSSPMRRQAILEREKYPCVEISSYYEPARAAIVDYLLGRIGREGLLLRYAVLEAAMYESRYAMHKARGCAEAVLRFLDLEPSLDLRGMTPVLVERHDKLDVEGVAIAVEPDLVLEGRGQTGALKLLFGKGIPRSHADIVAVLLCGYTLASAGQALGEACLAVDVFSGTVRSVPTCASGRRGRDIEAACDEIRRRWPTV